MMNFLLKLLPYVLTTLRFLRSCTYSEVHEVAVPVNDTQVPLCPVLLTCIAETNCQEPPVSQTLLRLVRVCTNTTCHSGRTVGVSERRRVQFTVYKFWDFMFLLQVSSIPAHQL